MSKLFSCALWAVLLSATNLPAQRLLGVHADATVPSLTLRIPEALSIIRDVNSGAFDFRYGSTSTGTWVYSGIPAGTYEMWHSAPGFDPAGPWALSNPVTYAAAGDTWASACLNPNPALPRMKFQVSGTLGAITIGTSLDLEFQAQPFSAMFLLAATAPQLPPLPLPGLGSLIAFDLLAPSPFYVLDLGACDASGNLFSFLPVPPDPTLRGGVLFLQGLEATPSFALQLANVLAIRFV